MNDKELKVFHFYNQKEMLKICRKIGFVLSVNSTSLLYYKRFFEKEDILNFKISTLRKAFILLACKVEDIHEQFSALMDTYNETEEERRAERELILNYERYIAEKLNFKFHVPAPYTRIQGYIIIFQERGIITFEPMESSKENKLDTQLDESLEKTAYFVEDVDMLWEKSIKALDKILLLDYILKLKNYAHIIPLAAIDLPIEVLDKYNEEYTETVKRIREDAINIDKILDEEIESAIKSYEIAKVNKKIEN